MRRARRLHRLLALTLLLLSASASADAQRRQRADAAADEFGPNVRAYLGYLSNEQEVVDDRASRREIDRRYYLHNSNRINALRQMALRIARESGNDYLPEMEAVSLGEFDQLFDDPLPEVSELEPGLLLDYKFRYLGMILTRGEKFYLFARLDPYEQSELRQQGSAKPRADGHTATAQPAGVDTTVRPRRVNSP